MKIGIVTFWQTRDNYGQMLQGLALQYKLKEMGHEPFLIRYAHTEHGYSLVERVVNAVKNILKLQWNKIILKRKRLPTISEKDKRRAFEEFKKRYLNQSDKIYYTLSELRKEPPGADCYIVGSDQVWSRSLTGGDGRVFYLDFGSKNIKRLSYAASFGNAQLDEKRLGLLKKRTSNYCAVSVREKTGKEICEKAGIDAVHVLDPTMLLNVEDYIKILGLKKKKENNIFVYALNISKPEEIGWYEIKKYAENENCKVFITPSSGYIECSEIFGKNEHYSYSTISEWCNMILSSKLVVTTSFHGVVFCILFHTPFVYVPLNGKFAKGNSRVLDLLDLLDLQNRIYLPTSNINSIIQSYIDWKTVDDLLKGKQKESLDFLQKSLKK